MAAPTTPVPHVDPNHFPDVDTLTERHRLLDDRGLRSTASPAHEAYIDDLEHRLRDLGFDVLSDPVPVQRWTATRWSLTVGADEVRAGSYVPFSGATPAAGVTGPLSADPAPGVVGLVHIAAPALREADFAALDWDAPNLPLLPTGRDLDAPYERIWLAQQTMRDRLDAFAAAGAAGMVFVVDAAFVEIDGSYLLYDGVLRGLPALVVDRDAGRSLTPGSEATLVLEADVDQATSRNLYAVVPGTSGVSGELVLVQSHTDGTNALEDNGPEAIVAMAEHLVATGTVPDRGLLLVLSTGHFATHTAWGLAAFLREHRDDLVARTVAALSIEHLGARAWTPGPDGYEVSDGYELGCFFASPHRAVVDAVRRALERAAVTDALVVRPFTPDETGESPDGLGWPGDGTVLWNIAHLPSANFITGPGYLLTTMPTLDLIDVDAMRRQTIAFLEATLELAALPTNRLGLAVQPATHD